MTNEQFQAFYVDETGQGRPAGVRTVSLADLPPGDTLVRVQYSTLNYKDGLAVTGKGKVIRRYPMAPGIDLAGVVEHCENGAFQPGDAVLATGWGLGETHWGGFAQRARLPSDWLLPIPEGLDAKRAMAIGTAGFTAMLCVMALEENGLAPDRGPVAVTGAAGGVGSIAVALLGSLGYETVASTGRPQLEGYLKGLGATRILPRSELDRDAKPLESETWAGAVDTVGGKTLATLLAQMRRRSSLAACGLAGGAQLATTVFPFILRGVRLLGIESPLCPRELRVRAWERLARELPLDKLDAMTETVPLAALPEKAEEILAGKVRGRIVVDLGS